MRFVAVTLLALVAFVACAPPQFASVKLLVREPEGQHRLADESVNIFFQLDSPKGLVSDTFDPGTTPTTPPFELGDKAHTLFTALSTGALATPDAFGRADAVSIPAFQSPGIADQITLPAPLLLAKPNVAEPIVSTIPTARTGSAACSDAKGNAWVVGGVDGAGNFQKGYTFELATLQANVAFEFNATGSVACDGDGRGGVIAAGSAGGPTEVVFNASAGATGGEVLNNDPDEALAVQTEGEVVWVFDSTSVYLFHVDGGPAIAQVANPQVDAGAHLLALDESDAIRFNSGGTADLIKHAAGALESFPIANVPAGYVASDARAHIVLHDTGGGFELVQPVLANDTVTFKTLRTIAFDGVNPTEIIALSDGRIAGFQVKNGKAFVDVEGSPQAIAGNREHMARTIGDALLLFGGDAGHDVITTP